MEPLRPLYRHTRLRRGGVLPQQPCLAACLHFTSSPTVAASARLRDGEAGAGNAIEDHCRLGEGRPCRVPMSCQRGAVIEPCRGASACCQRNGKVRCAAGQSIHRGVALLNGPRL